MGEKIGLREVRNFPSLHKTPNPDSPSDEFFYKPYLEDNQTLMMLDLLERLKPRKCFEWGSGWSTVFFPRFLPDTRWISVEHHTFFVKVLKPHLPPNAVIIQREIGQNYVEEVLNWAKGPPFDFAFVDGVGHLRIPCVKMASFMLRKGGIAVMHDIESNDPMMMEGEDIRTRFEEYGVIQGLWWGRK